MDAPSERSHPLGGARPMTPSNEGSTRPPAGVSTSSSPVSPSPSPTADSRSHAGPASSVRGRRLDAMWWFTVVVGVSGFALLIYLAKTSAVHQISTSPSKFWLLAALVTLGEWFPITLSRLEETQAVEDEITTSTTFAFALLLIFGTGAAAVALALASALSGAWQRKSALRIFFNVGLYTLSVASAGLVYTRLGAPREVSPGSVGVIAASGLTFFVTNELLITVWIALGEGVPPL